MSARVGDFFKIKQHKEPNVPAKVAETETDAPPKIDEPTPVAPLENPAAEEAAPAAEAPKAEEPKDVPAAAPAAAPQVAAAA